MREVGVTRDCFSIIFDTNSLDFVIEGFSYCAETCENSVMEIGREICNYRGEPVFPRNSRKFVSFADFR